MNTCSFLKVNLATHIKRGKRVNVACGSLSEPRWLTINSVASNGAGVKTVHARVDGKTWKGWYDPKRDLLFLHD